MDYQAIFLIIAARSCRPFRFLASKMRPFLRKVSSSKGNKGLYEWFGLDRKDNLPRIVAGKYLKLLYEFHEMNGTLDSCGLDSGKKLDVLDLENRIVLVNK